MPETVRMAEEPVAVVTADVGRAPPDPAAFQRRLTVLVLAFLFAWLLVWFLEKFASVLQPFLIACLIVYAILPVHTRLVRWGVPSTAAYAALLAGTLTLFLGVGEYVYASLSGQSVDRWAEYRDGVETLATRALRALPAGMVPAGGLHLDNLLSPDSRANAMFRGWARTAVGELFGLLTTCLVVFVYLLFLIAEVASLPDRVRKALPGRRAEQVLAVAREVNHAIGQYIGLKSFVSLLQAVLSLIVLAGFGVDFAVMWAVLIFLLNFIPYIGSTIAVGSPIVLAFVQYPSEPWRGVAVALLLLLVQRVIDSFVEPRLTGRQLGLSPLLILLTLAFWGSLWGIVGMILAVPLTVIGKIILEAIPETRPIATLLSSA